MKTEKVEEKNIGELLERLEKLENEKAEMEAEADKAKKEYQERLDESKKLMEERVPIRLRYDTTKGESVFACVNGKTILIKRGEEVEIPKAFDEVLRHAEEQSEAAQRYIERMSGNRD